MKIKWIFLSACAVSILLACKSPPPKQVTAISPSAPAKTDVSAKDYFPDSIKLAGIGDRVGGPYTVNFYAAEVIKPPSAATRNEGLVRPRGRVEGSSEKEFWTPYIASSRPATKEELKPGMIVFAAGDAQPRSQEELAKINLWYIYRVKDISNLYKNTVILTYYNTYGNPEWKSYEFHLSNIRVLVGDLPLKLIELP